MKHNGKDGEIHVEESGTTPAVLAQTTSYTFEDNCELAETTSLGDDSKRRTAGLRDSSLSVSVFYDSTGATSGQDIFIPGTEIDVKLYPEGTAVGKRTIEVTMIIQSVSLPVEVAGVITQEISAEGNSDVTYDVVPAS